MMWYSSTECFALCHLVSSAEQLYDLGGGRSIRRIWGIYAPEVHGVIYVVDSADQTSLSEARSALQQLMAAPHLAGKPLLLFANKQDLPGAQPLSAVTAAMSLQELQAQHQIPCTAMACTAKGAARQQQADPALREGLQWLYEAINPLYGQLQQKIAREAAAAKAEEEQRRQQRVERARQNKLAREKLEQEQEQQQQQQQQRQQQHDQEQQQTGQQQPWQLAVHQPDKQLSSLAANQDKQQQQPQQEHQQEQQQPWPERQLISTSTEHSAICGSHDMLSGSAACSEGGSEI